MTLAKHCKIQQNFFPKIFAPLALVLLFAPSCRRPKDKSPRVSIPCICLRSEDPKLIEAVRVNLKQLRIVTSLRARMLAGAEFPPEDELIAPCHIKIYEAENSVVFGKNVDTKKEIFMSKSLFLISKKSVDTKNTQKVVGKLTDFGDKRYNDKILLCKSHRLIPSMLKRLAAHRDTKTARYFFDSLLLNRAEFHSDLPSALGALGEKDYILAALFSDSNSDSKSSKQSKSLQKFNYSPLPMIKNSDKKEMLKSSLLSVYLIENKQFNDVKLQEQIAKITGFLKTNSTKITEKLNTPISTNAPLSFNKETYAQILNDSKIADDNEFAKFLKLAEEQQ